jgi:hypothetical protein
MRERCSMSFKEASRILDELYNELADLHERKMHCEDFAELVICDTRIAEIEYEIEQIEIRYMKYL